MDNALITILTGTGVTGVFCVMFIIGLIFPRSVVTDKDEEISELKLALAEERKRADASVAAADTTNKLLAAIRLGQQLGPPVP